MYKYYEKLMNAIYGLQLLRLKLFGAKIGTNVRVYGRFVVAGHPKRLSIGDNVTINEGVFLNCRDRLEIGDECRLSSYAKIYTASLNMDEVPRGHNQNPTTLAKNVWIASNALVSQGVNIGENSVVGASSVVTSDVPANIFVAGAPAKKIRDIAV